MGQQPKQASNSATGFSNQFQSMLSQLLGMGGGGGVGGSQAGASTMGSNPVGQSLGGGAGILQNILGNGAGVIGGAYQTSLNQQNQQNIDALRARFGAMGGTSMGTPGSSAEAMYRAYASPQQTMAIGNLQMGALGQLLGQSGQLANRGVTTPYLQSNPFVQGLQALGGGVQGFGSLMSGLNMGGGGGGMTDPFSGAMISGMAPSASGITPGFSLQGGSPYGGTPGYMTPGMYNPYIPQQMGYSGGGNMGTGFGGS